MRLSAAQLAELETDGFVIVPYVIPVYALESLREETDRLLAESTSKGGVRSVLSKSSLLAFLATSGAPCDLARSVLGTRAQACKLTIFDKTPEANWKVPWHQDLTIAVKKRVDLPGYGPWTVKDGVVHVQPPVCVLENILAIRIHLDDTRAEDGALRVLPGAHKLGRLTDDEIASLRGRVQEEVCPIAAGGVMLMRPLLLHASSACQSPSRRRVLHFEYRSGRLPRGLAWA